MSREHSGSRDGGGREKAVAILLHAPLKGGGFTDYSPETQPGEMLVGVQRSLLEEAEFIRILLGMSPVLC